MSRILCIIFLMSVMTLSFSKSFGVFGETFVVAEMSFLDFIEQRLQKLMLSGEWQSMESAWQARAANSANRPLPVGLPRTRVARRYHYDPSIVLKSAILDEKGRVIHPTGTRVNGLERLLNYKPCWLFFNADDSAQLLWAHKQMQQCQNPKLILTGGAVRDAENALAAPIYFDQEGRLSARFQLNAVPAIVVRDGNRLQITEVVIKERGDAI